MPVEVTAMKNTPSKRGSLLTAAWYRRSSVSPRGDTLPPGAPPPRGTPPDPRGPDPDGPRPPRAATPVTLSVMPLPCQPARTRTGGNRTSTPRRTILTAGLDTPGRRRSHARTVTGTSLLFLPNGPGCPPG